MDDSSLVEEMIALFLKNTPTMVANLKRFNEQEQFEKLREEAHKYKPTLSYMGMEKANLLLTDIEKFAKERTNLERIPGKIRRLEELCDKAGSELQQVLDKLK